MIDEERMQNEQAMLNRLSIGLIDQGAQVTRMVPEQPVDGATDHDELRMALAQRVIVPTRVLPGMRRTRAQRLAAQLQKSLPDVLYAVGERAGPIAVDLAEEIDRPVVFDAWCMAQVRQLPRVRWARRVAALVAPCEPLALALRESFEDDQVHCVPYGVPQPGRARTVLGDPTQAVSVAIIGSGRDLVGYRAMLSGLQAVMTDAPQLLAFLELRGANEHELWRMVRRARMDQQVSALTSAAQHRPLLTRCDALVLPERLGEVRSLVLESMAAGMPVMASDDPVRDMLKPEDTAVMVAGADAESWGTALRRLIDDPERLRAIGQRGRELVGHRYRSSDQARLLLRVIEAVVRTDTLAFPGAHA